MTDKILVTGAFGNVGAEVVKQLQIGGSAIRAADINVERMKNCFGDSIELVEFNFAKKETYHPTFDGIEKMFLMRPPQISNVKRMMYPALDAAQAAGVKQVVFLSLIGIENMKFVPHYKVEKFLINSPMSWTFLRSNFFMQNLNTTHRLEIRNHNEILVPAGRARVSAIDVRDIAAVAATTLTQPGHENKAYNLTGSEALDYWQMSKILSEVLGREITYRNPSGIRFLLNHLMRGTPPLFALVMLGLYTSTRNGMAAPVTDEVTRIIGRMPLSFRQYVQDYSDAWL